MSNLLAILKNEKGLYCDVFYDRKEAIPDGKKIEKVVGADISISNDSEVVLMFRYIDEHYDFDEEEFLEFLQQGFDMDNAYKLAIGDLKFDISETFSTATPESLEHGDFEETGFVRENVTLTYRELEKELHQDGYCHLSNSHPDFNTYISTDTIHDRDHFEKGHDKTTALHWNHSKQEKSEVSVLAKVWVSAISEAAGIKKEPTASLSL